MHRSYSLTTGKRTRAFYPHHSYNSTGISAPANQYYGAEEITQKVESWLYEMQNSQDQGT